MHVVGSLMLEYEALREATARVENEVGSRVDFDWTVVELGTC